MKQIKNILLSIVFLFSISVKTNTLMADETTIEQKIDVKSWVDVQKKG